MKKKSIINIGIIWILLLIAFSTPQLISVKPVQALTKTSVIWGSNLGVDPVDNSEALGVIAYISPLFSGYSSPYNPYNGYDTLTTQNNVYAKTYITNHYYDYSVVFHTGHGFVYDDDVYDIKHYYLYSDDSISPNDGIRDEDIYDRTGSKTHRFIFIWTCSQADEGVGSAYPTPHGMAHCWTHKYMNSDGFHTPDSSFRVFIGFHEISPNLSETAGPYGYCYGNFIKYFYYFALYHHLNIHDSLNCASDWVYGVPFDQCELWNGYYRPGMQGEPVLSHMRVFGDSSMTLYY